MFVQLQAGGQSVHQFLAIVHELASAGGYECYAIGQNE